MRKLFISIRQVYISEEKRAMNRYMNRMANSVILDADVIVFMIDATSWRSEDEMVFENLKKRKNQSFLSSIKLI